MFRSSHKHLVLRTGALGNLELLTQQSCQRDTSSSPSRLLVTQTSSLSSHQVIFCRALPVHCRPHCCATSSHLLSSSPCTRRPHCCAASSHPLSSSSRTCWPHCCATSNVTFRRTSPVHTDLITVQSLVFNLSVTFTCRS